MNISCHAMRAENVTQFGILGWQNTFILDYKTMCFRHGPSGILQVKAQKWYFGNAGN